MTKNSSSGNIINNTISSIGAFFSQQGKATPNLVVFLIYFILILLVSMLSNHRSFSNLKVGDVVFFDIVADKNIKYFDYVAARDFEKKIRNGIVPVFVMNNEVLDKTTKELELIFNKVGKSSEYKDLFLDTKQSIYITTEDFFVFKNLMGRFPGFSDIFINIYKTICFENIIDLSYMPEIDFYFDEIIVEKTINGKLISNRYPFKDVRGVLYARDRFEVLALNNFPGIGYTELFVLVVFFQRIFNSPFIYSDDRTSSYLDDRLKQSELFQETIKRGQIIARKGDLITESQFVKVEALNDARGLIFNIRAILSNAIFFLFLSVVTFFFIRLFSPLFFNDTKNTIFILLVIFTFTLYIILLFYIGVGKDDDYLGMLIPLPAFALTFSILYSQRLSIVFIFILLPILFIFSNFNNFAIIFTAFSGIIATFTVSNIKKRADLFLVGFIIGFLNLILVSVSIFVLNISNVDLFKLYVISFLNGLLSATLAFGFILLGESILNVPTIFRLQELSDMSNKLLNDLFNRANGTYSHSINVGNLAEQAAIEVSRNGYLARVGGYYHDIGKITIAEYFVENQTDHNPHDYLKPSMSVTIIKSHVKFGVDRAIQARLPTKLIDIIRQHHGNSLIRFFYNKATNSKEANNEEIMETMYRYNENNPQFPEAAIVLLADQAEAATRAMQKKSASNIEKTIESIVDFNFKDGILDDSGLTLKDLTKIKKVFIKAIIGMYHARIEYPDQVAPKEADEKK